MDGTIMEVTLKITRSHGRTIPEPNVKVGPVNNVLSSLFESLEMRINDKQITESGTGGDPPRKSRVAIVINRKNYNPKTWQETVAMRTNGLIRNSSKEDKDLDSSSTYGECLF